MFVDLALILTIIIIISIIIAIIIAKYFSYKTLNEKDLIEQKEIREILDKYKVELGFGNISFYISAYETTEFQINTVNNVAEKYITKQNLILYCQVYNINCDILLKKDFSNYHIIYDRGEIKKLIELFTSILDNSKYDDKKEKVLKSKKTLKKDNKNYEDYNEIILIKDVKEFKKICEKAINKNNNIAISESDIGKEEGEEFYAQTIDWLPLYCKVYNINDDILYKIDPFGCVILRKEEILKLIELLTYVLDDSKYDEEKEKILKKALGKSGYDSAFLIRNVKDFKELCKKAIKENKNLICLGD